MLPCFVFGLFLLHGVLPNILRFYQTPSGIIQQYTQQFNTTDL
jgi:hypothetical protein